MPNENDKGKYSSFDFFSNIFQYNLRKIDSSDYKTLGLILIVAIFLAAASYAVLRISQEISSRQKADLVKPDTTRSDVVRKETKVADVDQQRKNDIFILNSSLKAYFLDKETVPNSLNQLTPDFIAELPQDPETGNPYNYDPSEDKKSWTISVILSDGSVFELLGP